MGNFYQKLLDWAIHPKLIKDPEIFRKAKFAADFSFLNIATALLYTSFYVYAGFIPGIISVSFGYLGVAIAFFILKKIGHLHLLAHWYAFTILYIISPIGFWDGGIQSVAFIHYCIGILGAFWIGNMKIGFLWTAIFMSIMIALGVFEYLGIQFPDWIIGQNQVIFVYLVSIGILGFVAQISAISEMGLQDLQSKLSKSKEQLVEKEKMASLGQLTAGIAHEINNPINFMNGNAIALQMDLKDLEPILAELLEWKKSPNSNKSLQKIKNHLSDVDLAFVLDEMNHITDGIQRGSKRIQNIVSSLKTFSHQSEEKFSLHQLNDLLNAALTILQNKINEHQIVIRKHYGDLPEISCMPARLNQVFMNLLDNAIDAIGMKGTITLSTSLDNDYAIISIHDTGVGIEEQDRPYLFDPFYTTKEIGKGTGLGLSISYGIIKEHGGRIEVFSKLNEGTEFRVKLPLKEAPATDNEI